MAKNLSREFATMSEDERRRFTLEEEEGTSDHPSELVFDEPRNEDNMGPKDQNAVRNESTDPNRSESGGE